MAEAPNVEGVGVSQSFAFCRIGRCLPCFGLPTELASLVLNTYGRSISRQSSTRVVRGLDLAERHAS